MSQHYAPAAAWLVAAVALLLAGCQQPGDRDADGGERQRRPGTSAPEPGTGNPSGMTPAGKPPVADPGLTVEHWQCGDLRVATVRDTLGGAATIHFSGMQLRLPAATSGSPGHYADANGNVFQLRDRTAHLAISGDETRDCTPTAQPSPWFEATARGVAFRAVGSEPGWFVEVGAGDALLLRATLDYGERKIEASVQEALMDDRREYRGAIPDGSHVVLRVRREACADGMSGERFEARAELVVGERSYEGCGAFLSD